MKFIIDAQLPQVLVSIFEGHDVIHTLSLQAGNKTPDYIINELSISDRRVLITKDSDFYYSFLATHKPYKLVLVKLGNMKLQDLKDYFRRNAERISAQRNHSKNTSTMDTQSPTFTHVDPATNQPAMVDVSDKAISKRTALARTIVVLGDTIMQQLSNGEIQTKKGPVFQTAIIAGTMAAKKTSELIPFCHPIGLDNCKLSININDANEIVIECLATVTAKTGVEMEALTGASVAALTIYDMCKGLSQDIVIRETRLIEKTGGKSDYRFNQ